MLFTLFIAVLAAALWALRSFLVDASVPHDPSTFELASIGVVTLATYGWMKRLRTIRRRAAALAVATNEVLPPTPVPVRFAEAKLEAAQEQSLEAAERVA